jgi:hypothetical protein
MEVTPSDFLHMASSGVDFSGTLAGLVKFMNVEVNCKHYVQTTTVAKVNQFADLMVSYLQNEACKPALDILINLSYCSVNTCIYLSDVLQIVPQLIHLADDYPFEVNWLLAHLLSDGKPDVRRLVSSRYFYRIRSSLDATAVSVGTALL